MFWILFFGLVGLHGAFYFFLLRDVLQEGHMQYHWRAKVFEKMELRFYARLRLAYSASCTLSALALGISAFFLF